MQDVMPHRSPIHDAGTEAGRIEPVGDHHQAVRSRELRRGSGRLNSEVRRFLEFHQSANPRDGGSSAPRAQLVTAPDKSSTLVVIALARAGRRGRGSGRRKPPGPRCVPPPRDRDPPASSLVDAQRGAGPTPIGGRRADHVQSSHRVSAAGTRCRQTVALHGEAQDTSVLIAFACSIGAGGQASPSAAFSAGMTVEP